MAANSEAEFLFRIWVHPYDSPDVEVWYHGLESTDPGRRFVSEWAMTSIQDEDAHELFSLDKTKYWQVVGRARICGWFDYWGEYDEEITVLEFEKSEVPPDFW